MDNIELEIQVKIRKKENLLGFLEKNGKFLHQNRQTDEYFTPVCRDFTAVRPVEEWLRLRKEEGVFTFNYKKFHFDKDGKSQYRDEYETEIGSLELTKKILISLNFRSLVMVKKVRRAWLFKDYEIAFDAVEGLGDFVEIEYKGRVGKKDPKEITLEMINFLKGLDCGTIRRNYVGYPFQILFPREVIWEEQ